MIYKKERNIRLVADHARSGVTQTQNKLQNILCHADFKLTKTQLVMIIAVGRRREGTIRWTSAQFPVK